jgi:hypothetical protein
MDKLTEELAKHLNPELHWEYLTTKDQEKLLLDAKYILEFLHSKGFRYDVAEENAQREERINQPAPY